MEIIRGKQNNPQKVVIYGPEGVGKTSLAAQFPRPLFIDTEGSTGNYDVARMPRPTSGAMLIQQIQWAKGNPQEFDTLVIDTADWAERLLINDLLAKNKKTGIEDFGYGKGYTYAAEEFGRFLNLLEDVRATGKHIVLTAHATIKKFEQPDEIGAYDRWELKLSKQASPMLKEWGDLVLFVNYKTFVNKVDDKGTTKAAGGQRVMYTAHRPAWDAKNRHGLPDELPLDYGAIAHIFTAQSQITPIIAPVIAPEPDKETYWLSSNDGKVFAVPAGAPLPPEGEEYTKLTIEQYRAATRVPIQDTPPPPPTPAPVSAPAPATEKPPEIPDGLWDLMKFSLVTPTELLQAIGPSNDGGFGYVPEGTTLNKIPPDLWEHAIGSWMDLFLPKIKANRPPMGDSDLPFKI